MNHLFFPYPTKPQTQQPTSKLRSIVKVLMVHEQAEYEGETQRDVIE